METIIYTPPKKGISESPVSQKNKYKEYKLMLKNTYKKQLNDNLKRNLLEEFK